LLGLGALILAGCAAGNDRSQPADAIPTTPKVEMKAKPAEFPSLPPGAGEIDADAPQELTPTDSGLYYRILRRGDGKKPRASDSVVAHYKGWLDNGTQFDSSYDRNEPTPFPLNRVIPGWTEGLQLIGEGGMIELEIPGKLGYGPNGKAPQIPPNATLHFIVELKQVN
jgi:FKBP-type peptidyl-prolyl cis-trans isomerase